MHVAFLVYFYFTSHGREKKPPEVVSWKKLIISYPISSSLASKCCSSLLLKTRFRSSRSQMFFKIGVLKSFPIFTGKHLCWKDFIKKRSCFPMNIAKFLRTAFFYKTLPVPLSGHLNYFLILLFLTFFISLPYFSSCYVTNGH